MNICRICQNDLNNREYKVREMMFGLKQEFTYFQCSKCKCLQIAEIPDSIASFYPDNYYSLNHEIKWNETQSWFRKLVTIYYLNSSTGLPYPLKKFVPTKLASLKATRLKLSNKVLDVGCGSGYLLRKMHEMGFDDLTGIDRFIGSDKKDSQRLRIFKKEIFQLNETFDFIMFHHSFEHMEHQNSVLKKTHELLSPNGTLLIRVPTVSSYAWEKYGVNWVELDAPRHYFLHSLESFRILANKANFEITRTVFDSTGFEVLGSIQYEQNIPLRAKNSYSENLGSSIFNEQDINNAETLVKKLNKEKRGGRVCFYLKKIS